MGETQNKQNKQSSVKKRAAIIIAAILILLVGITLFLFLTKDPKENFNPIAKITGTDPGYNFDELKNQYPDIIGWIKVPGTAIDTPLVQHPLDDFFYLRHNAKQETDIAGAAYIQMKNNKDLTDPVTLIYGHNTLDDRIFSTQLRFSDPNFFKSNKEIIVYKPHHKLTYKIISAYVYDDKHILNSFNFSKPDVLRKYFDYVVNPDSIQKNVTEGAQLKDTDKIITLSTCMNDLSIKNQRYLLNGVLDKDENTD